MYVYFVRSFEPDMVKVGHSKEPRERLNDMQVGSAGLLRLLGTIECASRLGSARLEKKIHAAISLHWSHGEWHFWTFAVEKYVMNLLKGDGGSIVMAPELRLEVSGKPVTQIGNVIPIEEAAAKHRVDIRRLRGAVWTNRLFDPIGDAAMDLVQNDDTLRRWVEKQRGQQS